MRFDLNFYLPIVEDITFVSGWQDFAKFKYRFVEVKKRQNLIGFEEVVHTSIIMDYYPEMEWQKDLSDARAAITNCLIFLNNFIDAYRLVSGFEYIKNFALTDLPPYLNMEIDGLQTLYTLPHFVTESERPEISREVVAKALEQSTAWRLFRPLEIIDRFRSKAIHHMYNEEFVFAIIELQTSFETYIRLCHHIILDRQGKSEEYIESKMSIPLKNAIEQHLSKGLNENLKIHENPVMMKWNTTLYKMRNNIVHSGLSYITGSDAYAAYDAYQQAINYLSDLMVREKLINANKMININDLNKNILENIDPEKIIKEMKSRGIATFLEDRD